MKVLLLRGGVVREGKTTKIQRRRKIKKKEIKEQEKEWEGRNEERKMAVLNCGGEIRERKTADIQHRIKINLPHKRKEEEGKEEET